MKLEAYHYSSKGFDAFDNLKMGSNVDGGYFGKGFYFWSDRDEAEHYGSRFGNYVYDCEIVGIKPFFIDLDNNLADIVKSIGFDKPIENKYLDLISEYGEIETTGYFEDSGIEKVLQAKGFNAIIIKNRSNIYGDEICVFDAANIKITETENLQNKGN